MTERLFLYNDTEETKTRFISFWAENQRFDLAIVRSSRYFGKQLVLNMLGNRFAIIGPDDLAEEGFLEYAFGLSEEDAEKSFHSLLADIIY